MFNNNKNTFSKTLKRTFVVVVILVILVFLFVTRDEFSYSRLGFFKTHSWNKVEIPSCIRTNLTRIIDYNHRQRCWQNFFEKNQQKILPISPDNVLCAFEPLHSRNYKRAGKKTVILGIGVHLGPAASGKYTIPCANTEYISWEWRDKNFNGLQNLLIHGYWKEHISNTQRKFWEAYKNDKDLQRADIIVCGFDTWHCLIFAPFNKKLVLDSAYRFDGHIAINEANMVDLQKVFYQAVRYNPDVIMAGEIVYDVMYHQHFLGSHKMIPTPTTCDYVRERMRSEVKSNQCKDVPKDTKGYHPSNENIIAISPSTLSGGGQKVADKIFQYFQKHQTKLQINTVQKGTNFLLLLKE